MSAPKEQSIQFVVTTPDGVLYRDAVEKITVTTSHGQITILPNHIPLVSDIMPGLAMLTKDGKEEPFLLHGGCIEVRPENVVVVLADAGERPEHIDPEEAEQAVERARRVLREAYDTSAFEDAALSLEKELARVRAVHKYRKKGYRTSHQKE